MEIRDITPKELMIGLVMIILFGTGYLLGTYNEGTEKCVESYNELVRDYNSIAQDCNAMTPPINFNLSGFNGSNGRLVSAPDK